MIIVAQDKHNSWQNDGVSIFGKKICILIWSNLIKIS